jgi:hypothetical protein
MTASDDIDYYKEFEKEYNCAEKELKKGVTLVKKDWQKKINKAYKKFEKSQNKEDENELLELLKQGDKAVNQADKDAKKSLTLIKKKLHCQLKKLLKK